MIMTLSRIICQVVSAYCFLVHQLANGYNIDCSITQCDNAFINCLPSEDCSITCSEPHECSGSIINCPVNGDCDVQCIGEQSCFDTTIDATLSSGHLTVFCGDQHSQFVDHCNTIKIFGSTLHQNTDIDITCNGNCIDADINCPFYGDCHVFCEGSSSCKYSHITGPIDGHLDINCNAPAACANAVFNGAASSTLDITGCQSYHSCLDLTIYCPQNTNGDINCFIEGNDNLGRNTEISAPTLLPTTTPTTTQAPTTTTRAPTVPPLVKQSDGILIYAVNGWRDILVNYTGTYSRAHGGKMFCGHTYDVSCSLAADDWSCGDMYHDCENAINANAYKPSITPETTTVSRVDVQNEDETPSEHNSHSSVDYSYVSDKDSEGDLFIVICVMCVVLTCIGVGFAQLRKNMTDKQRGNNVKVYNANTRKQSALVRRQHSASVRLSLRRQQSLSSKPKPSELYRHQQSQSRDQVPKEMESVLI